MLYGVCITSAPQNVACTKKVAGSNPESQQIMTEQGRTEPLIAPSAPWF